MALVDYGSNSDSDDDKDENIPQKNIINNILTSLELNENNNKKSATIQPSSLSIDEELPNLQLKFNLPVPKSLTINKNFHEIDDEFLRKKPAPIESIKKREKIKITIPSLVELDDNTQSKSKKSSTIGPQKQKSCGLLGILPQPKSGNLIIPQKVISSSTTITSKKLIPPQIKLQMSTQQPAIIEKSDVTNGDNDDSEDPSDSIDFFSLNSNDDLPEENTHQIKQLIADKIANIGKSARKLNDAEQLIESIDTTEQQQSISTSMKIDREAMQALCGSTAKRVRIDHVNIIELSADEVLPDKNEWLRHQMQASTEYQPRGLVDEEPAAGTRKKHQITYLAHQAKANEQELQAMWASNRHARRLTQSKYGF